MKKVLFTVLFLISVANLFAQTRQTQVNQPQFDLAQYGVKIEPDKRLIVVMASLEAGGIETPLTKTGEGFRQKLRARLQNLDPDLRQKIKTFVEQYRQKHPGATGAKLTAPFVSLAYALGPVPNLNDPPQTTNLPADLLEVFDYAALVREFYRHSGIEALLPEYEKSYQAEGDKMRGSAIKMVSELLGYLHTKPELVYTEKVKTDVPNPKDKKKPLQRIETREHERRFYIVPDLLSSVGTINFRNIGDEYYAVVPPDTDLSVSEVRRAYLRFIVDPLVLRYARDIVPFREGIKKLLDERQKTGATVLPDAFLAVSRSLVAAIEAREIEYQKIEIATTEARRKIDLAQGVEAKRAVSAELERRKQSFADETAAQLSDAYENGAVLSFYFADQLKGLENSGFDIASSFREMILSLDAAKEQNRLAQFAEARRRALQARQERKRKNAEQGNVNIETLAAESALSKRLQEIESVIKNKNYAEADAQLKILLEKNPNESRVYYALGRLSSITAEGAFDEILRDKRLGDAQAYYNNAIRIGLANPKTDPALIQLSYVALGRIYEFYEQKEMAVKIYEAAIKIGDVKDGAYSEAQAAKERLAKNQ